MSLVQAKIVSFQLSPHTYGKILYLWVQIEQYETIIEGFHSKS